MNFREHALIDFNQSTPLFWPLIILFILVENIHISGASAAQRAAKRSPIII